MTTPHFVLLDRDGVINQDADDFVKSVDEWQPIDGSFDAIALLNAHGYRVAVITNQSGLARGLFDETTLTAMHDKMRHLARQAGGAIDAVYFCPHGQDSDCECRKPKPGLLQQCAADFGFTLAETYFIGDSLRDIQAAEAAGAKPILVKTGKGQKTLADNPYLNLPIFDSLYDAARYIASC